MLVLALVGLAIAVDLWLLWHRAHAGAGPAFCDIDDRLSCSRVALSPYAAVLGVPVAAWGALAYLLVACLAGWALARRPHAAFPGGLLLILAGVMTAGAAVLAYLSEVVIGAFCFMCSGSWAVSVGLLGCAVALVRRGGGVGPTLRADLAAVRGQAGLAVIGAVAFAALAVALPVVYALAPWRAAAAPARPAVAALPKGPPGSLIVYEFSDYMCPHCATLHRQEPRIVAQRPDVRFVRRFFPLDAACNPLITRTVPGHEVSCDLARGGVCAEKQGRFEAYDDAAFASQGKNLGAEAIAQQVGLDLAALRDCLAAPETERRVAEDAQAGIQLGIRATPTLFIQGKLYTAAELPAALGIPPLE